MFSTPVFRVSRARRVKHSSYGRDSFGLLKQSVQLLFRNYNSIFLHDVVFFHTGDVPVDKQQEVIALCMRSRARFLQLEPHHFALPAGTPSPSTWRYSKKFSVGYRHMIRFFTSGLWQVMAQEGYEYVMRMDEDSFLWSPIRYNVFSFMASHGYEYGYRLASLERDGQAERFHTFVRKYSQSRAIQPTWLLHKCPHSDLSNFTLKSCGDTCTK
jgi:alpha 1,2-mannosyltransferase